MKPETGMIGVSQQMIAGELPSSGSCYGDELPFIHVSPLTGSDCFFSLDENEGISDLFDVGE